MLPIAELEKPLGLGAHAKATFQPEPPPREVKPEPAKPAPVVAPVDEAKPAPENPAKPAAVPEAAKPNPAPKSEEDAVFGTPPAKVEKPAAPNDEEFEAKLKAETQGMTPKAEAKWVDLRRSEKAAKEEARLAREEVKAAAEARQEANGADETAPKLEAAQAEITALKAQLEEAEKTISVTQFERSQKFRREVSEPMGELSKQVEDIATRYEVAPKDIMAALNADPKERTDLLTDLVSEFKEPDRLEIYEIARGMDRLRRAGDKLRQKATEDLSALELEEREEQDRTAAETTRARSAAAQRAWDEQAKALAFLRPNDAAPEWTAALARARAQSADYVPGQDPAVDGRTKAAADQLPFVLRAREHDQKVITSLREEVANLLERIKADTAADPDLGGAHDDDVTGGEDEGEGLSLGERAKRFVNAGK